MSSPGPTSTAPKGPASKSDESSDPQAAAIKATAAAKPQSRASLDSGRGRRGNVTPNPGLTFRSLSAGGDEPGNEAVRQRSIDRNFSAPFE